MMHPLLLLTMGFAAVRGMPSAAQLEERQSAPDYSYTGTSGPLGWGNLSPAYALCETGRNQSPIDIRDGIGSARVSSANYPNVPSAPFVNTGKTVEVIATGFSPRASIIFEGREYELENIHFHTPSEHRLFNEYYVLEVHLVHKLKGGTGLLVIGAFFQLTTDGSTTRLLTEIIRNIDQIKTAGSRTTTGQLNFAQYTALVGSVSFYRYGGSLTTPPCSEGVQWLVAERTLPLSVAQFNTMKDIIKYNSRYTQNTPGQENLLPFSCRA